MKIKKINKKHRVILQRIQDSIPKYLLDAVVKREFLSPTLREMLEKGINDTEFSQEVRDKWKLILDSGTLDKEVDIEVPEIAEEIDAYVELEMQKAVLRGELPKKKKNHSEYPDALKRYNLIKNENDKKYNRN